MELPFETELYTVANTLWPAKGKHILATVKNDTVLVYQAYRPDIAEWVCSNQTFTGCPEYSMERMTWIKPNFLWMMYRSGWASKVNQERILALSISVCGFRKLLELSKRRAEDGNVAGESEKGEEKFGNDDVRIQWDPDHDPFGEKVERRAIQLGVRGAAMQKFVKEWVVSISDITDFVKREFVHVQKNELELLQVPIQRVYNVDDDELRRHLDLDIQ